MNKIPARGMIHAQPIIIMIKSSNTGLLPVSIIFYVYSELTRFEALKKIDTPPAGVGKGL